MDKMRSYGIAAFLFVVSAGFLPAQNFVISTSSVPQGLIGVFYSTTLQTMNAESTVTWYICPQNTGECPGGGVAAPGLTLDGASGTISGTPTQTGTFTFTVQAEFNNSAPQIATKTFSLTINAVCVPTINPASLPEGDVGIPYPFTSLSASGCSGAYTFSVQPTPFNPNPLPPGLALQTSGNLNGTPSKAGSFTFTVTAMGQNQSLNTATYTVIINPLPTVTTASPLPNGPVNVPYSQQIAGTGGTPGASGYVFSMNNNPPGLSMSRGGLLSGTPTQIGTFSFNIGVTDSLGGQTSSPFQITFFSGTAQVQLSSMSLTFKADLMGALPGPQGIAVVAANGVTTPVNFTVLVDDGQSNAMASPLISRPPRAAAVPSWISVSPTSSTAPAGLVVGVNQGSMPAGAYPARIRVLDSNNIPTDVSVTLNVNNTPQKLSILPPMLRFGARAAVTANLVADMLVSNTGAVPLAFTASVAGGSSWITGITPNAGQTQLGSPTFLHVQVSTSGLLAGSYHDIIHISSPASNVDVPISLFVADSGPVMAVNTTGTLFVARQNAGSSAKHNIEILNIGDSNTTVNWTASVLSPNNKWLNLLSSSGTATPAAPGILSLALFQNATQLAAGPYYALIEITDSKSRNSPQFVSAVLNLEPDSAAPAPDVAPAGLYYTAIAGGSAPSPQQVLINTSSGSSVPFQVATTTTDLGSWLHATPPSGNAAGQDPGNLSVSVDPTGLAAGIYSGDVNVSISGVLESVNVTFVVLPSTVSSAISRPRAEVLGCTPSKLAITETSLANNFAVPAGWPATMIAQLNDDCGSLILDGNVTASFSNGDPALDLVGDSLGNYSATWAPSAVSSQMVVTLSGTSGALKPATAKLYGGIAQNQTPPPTLAQGGTLNNLNPVAGGSLAPGLIAQVYGSGLAPSPVSIKELPLPKIFDKTFAQVGAFQAPLYFLSNGQVNVQLPSELTGPQQVPIVLSVNDALTTSVLLDFVPTAPGVLSRLDGPTPPSTQNGAHIIAQHTNFTLVSSNSPAKPNEVLMMYLVGLGATKPSVPSGMPAPATTPLAKVTIEPIVMVDHIQATVSFAGLTPGFVGLYQINFKVPAGASSGDVEVDVTQNGVAANPTLLQVSQ